MSAPRGYQRVIKNLLLPYKIAYPAAQLYMSGNRGYRRLYLDVNFNRDVIISVFRVKFCSSRLQFHRKYDAVKINSLKGGVKVIFGISEAWYG